MNLPAVLQETKWRLTVGNCKTDTENCKLRPLCELQCDRLERCISVPYTRYCCQHNTRWWRRRLFIEENENWYNTGSNGGARTKESITGRITYEENSAYKRLSKIDSITKEEDVLE